VRVTVIATGLVQEDERSNGMFRPGFGRPERFGLVGVGGGGGVGYGGRPCAPA
jgi:hypothetical protein